MGMIEDIMKALERIPVWKRVAGLPDEIEKLKARITAIEQQLAGKGAKRCPICNAAGFAVVSSRPHADFGDMGIKLDLLRCKSCGHSEEQERNTMAT